jgi:hypothetical protein
MELLPPPGPERRRQVTRLAVLVILLAGVVWFWRSPAGTPSPASNPVTAAATPQGVLPVPEGVRLDALDAVATLTDAGRNPFTFGARRAAPESSPGTSFLTTPQPWSPPIDPGPPVPQGPPVIDLRLTGLSVVEAGGRTLVTLKNPSTNGLYQAFEGDIVDGRYRVVKVGVQSVVVSYLDGTGIRTLPLGG